MIVFLRTSWIIENELYWCVGFSVYPWYICIMVISVEIYLKLNQKLIITLHYNRYLNQSILFKTGWIFTFVKHLIFILNRSICFIILIFVSELFHTEKTHVRNLKILNKVFYEPLLSSNVLPAEQVKYIFCNLTEILDMHGKRRFLSN